MPARGTDNEHRVLGRGELVRMLYRLGRHAASGVLTITTSAAAGFVPGASGYASIPGHGRAARAEVFVLRRGHAITNHDELAKRLLVQRLVRLASCDALVAVFETGVAGVAPPAAMQGVALASWAREHLEKQLDSALGDTLLRELAGARLSIKPDLAPEPQDEADRRMLAAMEQPRRLDQIWPLARTPRFRLLAFLHFLRTVDALEGCGVTAERARLPPPPLAREQAARRVLGLDDDADRETIKRAYRRLARTLHPDLQPDADATQRRTLERRFAEVTAAYETLL